MILFRREITRKHLVEIPTYIRSFIRCFAIFANPFWVIRSYISQVAPTPNQTSVALKSGQHIVLSAQEHDVVTAFMIFARQEYGTIQKGQTVVDIGGNTGIFSLYAAVSGAAKINVYEPNSQACAVIQRNISENGFDGVAQLYQRCIDRVSHQQVRFPVTSSIFNKPIEGGPPATGQSVDIKVETESVETISLADILHAFPNGLDVLKIDCEGCEYKVLLDATPALLGKINAIRLEYHDHKVDEMISNLAQSGLLLTYHREDFPGAGMLFFERKR